MYLRSIFLLGLIVKVTGRQQFRHGHILAGGASANGGMGISDSAFHRIVPRPSTKLCRAATAARREVNVNIAHDELLGKASFLFPE